uniref:Transcriptional coactivator Hfi1/Transcriptional adapter 1 n=1 Tax=Leersia perrieri TaxID=77586 RepID=A0A0D9Y0V4_9ORYZ
MGFLCWIVEFLRHEVGASNLRCAAVGALPAASRVCSPASCCCIFVGVSKMQPPKKPARMNTMELKTQLAKKLGPERFEYYSHVLKKFLSGHLGKVEFDKICVAALGRENIKHHNNLLRSILSNVYSGAGPPPPSRQATTGNSQTSTVSVSNGAVKNHGMIAGLRRGPMVGNRERRFDRPSPLGKSPLGPQGTGEFVSAGSKAPLEVVSVEDGEEVNQAGGSPLFVQSRSPIRAPLGVPKAQNSQSSMPPSEICYSNGELPEAQGLLSLLENKLKAEGLTLTPECADVLNSGLNAYIVKLLKCCLGVAKSRGKTVRTIPGCPSNVSTVSVVNGVLTQGSSGLAGRSYQASLLDLQTALVCNPQLAGGNSSQVLDKIAAHLLDR